MKILLLSILLASIALCLGIEAEEPKTSEGVLQKSEDIHHEDDSQQADKTKRMSPIRPNGWGSGWPNIRPPQSNQCCQVVHPPSCGGQQSGCQPRRHYECSNVCSSPYMHIVPQQKSPQSQCLNVQQWPYQYCGGYAARNCDACYACGGASYNPGHCSTQPSCPPECRPNQFGPYSQGFPSTYVRETAGLNPYSQPSQTSFPIQPSYVSYPQPGPIPQPSFNMPQPSFSMPQPSFNMPQPSFSVPQPSFSMPQQPSVSTSPFYQGLAQPSMANLQPSFSTLQQPFSAMQQPSFANLQQPAAITLQQGSLSSLQQPGAVTLQQPHSGLYSFQQPGLGLQQPSFNLQQPSLSLQQPSFSLQQPSLSLQQPSFNLQQPSLSLQQPGLNLQQSGLTLQQPGLSLQQQPGLGSFNLESLVNQGWQQPSSTLHQGDSSSPGAQPRVLTLHGTGVSRDRDGGVIHGALLLPNGQGNQQKPQEYQFALGQGSLPDIAPPVHDRDHNKRDAANVQIPEGEVNEE